MADWMKLVKKCIAQKEQNDWRNRITKSKLLLYSKIKSELCQEEYILLLPTWSRRIFLMLRAGASQLRIETGRRIKEPRHLRTCRACVSNQLEDESHFMFYCPIYDRQREELLKEIFEKTDLHYNLSSCLDDHNFLLDAMIGRGFPDKKTREIVCLAVAKFLKRAFRRRKIFVPLE